MALYDELQDALSFVMPLLLETLPILHLGLSFSLSIMTLAFLARIIITWYPQVNLKSGFWFLVVWPTEPFLGITRKLVAPIGGVDVGPVIWVGLTSLFRELLVGQQGVLSQALRASEIVS